MKRHQATIVLGLALAAALTAAPGEAGWRNGQRFDPGTAMTVRAPGAPEPLDRVTAWLGRYDVEVTTPRAEGEPLVSRGQAEITFINRGHALMESFYSEDFGGRPHASLFFLGFNPASGRWFLGGADSSSERAWVADGGFAGERLVLSDTRRRRGGVGRTEIRYSFASIAGGGLRVEIAESADAGATWAASQTRVYTRREPSAGLLAPYGRHGAPRPDRPAAAAAFDFLIGEWDETHNMTFPNGQQVSWAANGTGVHALDGAAILEYSWFDVDPSLPDAATTILRIYNRAMRRWECLYVPNRGHTILYFGGVQEGERIVLGIFETDATAPLISRFVFHDVQPDSYAWYSEQSRDRGATWAKNWVIGYQRKPAAAAGAAAADGAGPG